MGLCKTFSNFFIRILEGNNNNYIMVNDKFKTIQCLPYKNNDGDEEGKRWRVEKYFLLWLKNRILHFS